MKKARNTNTDALAAVRKASREASVGGRPGQFNPNRSVRFASKATDKRVARGRTYRGED